MDTIDRYNRMANSWESTFREHSARQGPGHGGSKMGSLHLKVNHDWWCISLKTFFPHWKIAEATAICTDLQIHLNIGDAHFRKAQIYLISCLPMSISHKMDTGKNKKFYLRTHTCVFIHEYPCEYVQAGMRITHPGHSLIFDATYTTTPGSWAVMFLGVSHLCLSSTSL